MENQTALLSASTLVKAPIEKIWDYWTGPEHIMQWNNPSSEWKTTSVENDVRSGGKFSFVMEAENGGGFAFAGAYDEVIPHEKLSYVLSDGRRTIDLFSITPEGVTITELFDPEKGTPEAEQQAFCAGVLEHFRRYVENH
ncbi:SRPBCC domain-containing protein [Chitinophaga varians]|uniref:SRPBCC domain-containing protein n=1 Tax=Chitinophaga varians TaxID=2202339 RepID=UPI00165ECA41|nr:SRPBCC domain-containing protein [Chitinophaga varians]MBC9915138.1 SRPBCC domain-containing protein [Chitinophaga varians]